MADKVIQVNVTSTKSQRVSVSPGNVQNEISATPDTSQYYSNLAKSWAIGAGLILNEDYSSKHYANESANSASSAKNYADASQVTYTNVQNVASEALTDIEGARVDAVDNITTVKSESIASVEAKGNEVVSAVNEGIANINTAKTEAVNAVTSTKTTILNDIEFVADGEKEEIKDLVDAGKDEIQEGLNRLNTTTNNSIADINTTAKSYDNLTKRQITNCITEIPQRIKYTLSNGTLKIKAGSEIIVPSGFETNGTTPKFEYLTLTQDTLVSPTGGSGACLVCLNASNNVVGTGSASSVQNCVSGAGVTPVNYGMCYDTATNIVQRWGNGTVSMPRVCLPLMQITQTDGVITSVDQVFNGMGYIGSTIWVDKGVKGLIPNGRNEDGTLNNIEFTTSKVLITTNPASARVNLGLTVTGDSISRVALGTYKYDEEKNLNYDGEVAKAYFYSAIGARYDRNATGAVINFQPKQAFQAVDYNDIKNNIISTCQKSTNGYLKFANGIIIQWGEISVGGNGTAVQTLPIAFTNTNYQCSATCNVVSTGDDQNVSIGEKTTTTMKVCNGIGGTRTVMWIAIGY